MDQSITTFSASCTAIAKGIHEFEITSYSLYKSLEAGDFVESKTFAIGGHEWTIRFYPGDQNLQVYIKLASDGTNVIANYELTLIDQSGKNQHLVHRELRLRSFEWMGSMKGFHKFLERRLLDGSGYINNDSITIRCCMAVVLTTSKTVREEPNIYSVRVPPPNISQQFGHILLSREGCDIRFKVGEEIFAAHKCVLVARSPVFKAQFLGPMKHDDTKECIEILDMEAPVFKALLHFIYCDTLPDLEYLFAHRLLQGAERSGVERLQLMCEAKICEGITVDTAATTLVFAEKHHCLQLKSACLHYIAQQRNLKAVMQTDGFCHLEQTCPSVVCELMRVFSSVNL